MTYTYDLLLKFEFKGQYALYSLSGRKMFDIWADNAESAYNQAVAFMSSWGSVKITMETNDVDKV